MPHPKNSEIKRTKKRRYKRKCMLFHDAREPLKNRPCRGQDIVAQAEKGSGTGGHCLFPMREEPLVNDGLSALASALDVNMQEARKALASIEKNLGTITSTTVSEPREAVSASSLLPTEFLSTKTEAFFSAIIDNFFIGENVEKKTPETSKIKFIVVAHVVPDIFEFLEALSLIGSVHTIIPKGSSQSENVRKGLVDYCALEKVNISTLTRDDLADEQLEQGLTLVRQAATNARCIILDIGGYFAPCLASFTSAPDITKKLLGIVEDTENGFQQYEKELKTLPESQRKTIPIYSVARSRAKEKEDYNVGKAIVDNAVIGLAMMRQISLESFACVGVIGFGKIGRSIAEHLRTKPLQKLVVYDNKAEALLNAASMGFATAKTKEQLLKECQVIFCATGNKSIIISKDLKNMGNGVTYIVSCTSPDTEFVLQGKILNVFKQYNGIGCSEFTSKEGEKKACFLAEGKAINFYFQANAIGDYIRTVQAAIIVSVSKLLELQGVNTEGTIHTISKKDESTVFKIWEKIFTDTEVGTEHNVAIERNASIFYGRTRELQYIKSIFSGPLIMFNVHGEDGVGKTTLVHEFVRRYRVRYDYIWWIDSQDKDNAYRQLAENLGVSIIGKDRSSFISDIFRILCHDNHVLLIYNNVRKPGDIVDDLSCLVKIPQEQEGQTNARHVICISRKKISVLQSGGDLQIMLMHQQFLRQFRYYQVKAFDDKRSVSFIIQQIPALEGHGNEIAKLVKIVGGYPFLLSIIIKSLQNRVSKISSTIAINAVIDELCAIKIAEGGIVKKLIPIVEYVQGKMQRTFGVSGYWQQLLFVCAVLDGRCLQASLLYDMAAKIADEAGASFGDAKLYLQTFAAYGLMSTIIQNEQEVYYIHRAMQRAIMMTCGKGLLDNEQINAVLNNVVDVLSHDISHERFDQYADFREEYMPHVDALLQQDDRYNLAKLNCVNGNDLLLSLTFFYFYEKKDFIKYLQYIDIVYRRLRNTLDIKKISPDGVINGYMFICQQNIYNITLSGKQPAFTLLNIECNIIEFLIKVYKTISRLDIFVPESSIFAKAKVAELLLTLGNRYLCMCQSGTDSDIKKIVEYFSKAEESFTCTILAVDELLSQETLQSQPSTSVFSFGEEKTPAIMRIKYLALDCLGKSIANRYFIACKSGEERIVLLKEAKKHLEDAIKIGRECLPQSPEVVNSLQCLAVILHDFCMYDPEIKQDKLKEIKYLRDGLKCCKEARRIQSDILPLGHPDLQRTQQIYENISTELKKCMQDEQDFREHTKSEHAPASSFTVALKGRGSMAVSGQLKGSSRPQKTPLKLPEGNATLMSTVRSRSRLCAAAVDISATASKGAPPPLQTYTQTPS